MRGAPNVISYSVLGMNAMNINTAAIDNTALALLFLTLHDDNRAWKSFDWDALKPTSSSGSYSVQ